MFRRIEGHKLEVFLVHPGGPFWARKDAGAWSIPKGLVGEHGVESPIEAARREFREETGFPIVEPLIPLGSVQQKSRKVVHAWAFEADADPKLLRSNTFLLEWPPRSGNIREFPEVDRGEYFPISAARTKINPAQAEFLDRLQMALAASSE